MSQNDPIDGMISDISIPSVEDVVDYRIYLAKPREEPFQYYKTRLEEIIAFVEKSIVKDYIWQDEPFSLTIVEGLESSSLEPALPAESDSSIPLHCHFYGSTRFGDNIEDEWFIVSILQQLSLRFADLAIRYDITLSPLPACCSLKPTATIHTIYWTRYYLITCAFH
jgi:hypothetical protein